LRAILLVGLAGLAVAGIAGVRPAAMGAFYQEIYPSDPAKRQALDECIALDPRFNRLDSNERAACYRRGAAAAPEAAAVRAMPAGNFVDLWRAAGQGRLPQNDVRAEQQNARYNDRSGGRAR